MSLRIVLEFSPLLDCALKLSKLPFLFQVLLPEAKLVTGPVHCMHGLCQFWDKRQLKMLLSDAVLFADVAPKPFDSTPMPANLLCCLLCFSCRFAAQVLCLFLSISLGCFLPLNTPGQS